MNPVKRLLQFFVRAGQDKALEPTRGTKMKGSAHPRRPARGSGKKRKHKRKLQRAARRATRRAG